MAASNPHQLPDTATIGFRDAATRGRVVKIGFRRFNNTSVAVPGLAYVHVRDGHAVGFGIEPLGDVIIDVDGTVVEAPDGAAGKLDPVRVSAAGAACAALTMVVGIVLWATRRR